MEQGPYCQHANDLRVMLNETQRLISDLRSALAQIDKNRVPTKPLRIIYSEGSVIWFAE